jgi:pyruvate,water dikinase
MFTRKPSGKAIARYQGYRAVLSRSLGGKELRLSTRAGTATLARAFARLFHGFSIGSNDLTQLTLGVDRDSEIVAFDFDEREPGMLEMLRLAVTGAKRNHRHVGICARRRPTIPRSRVFWPGSGSIRSVSTQAA